MRTNIAAFILGSNNRKKIVKVLFAYRQRQWSCSTMEEVTGLPHATTFRALQGLHQLGLLKSTKINKKDILYELVTESPWISEIEQLLTIQERTARKIAANFAEAAVAAHKKAIQSIILYGSSVKGSATPESDIDLLIILSARDQKVERQLHNKAGEMSSLYNKTISLLIMDKKELKKEKKSTFLQSVTQAMEVIYGKGIS